MQFIEWFALWCEILLTAIYSGYATLVQITNMLAILVSFMNQILLNTYSHAYFKFKQNNGNFFISLFFCVFVLVFSCGGGRGGVLFRCILLKFIKMNCVYWYPLFMQFLTVQKTLQKSFSSIFYIPGCNNHPKAEIKVLGYVNQGSIQNGTDLYQNVIDSTVNNS